MYCITATQEEVPGTNSSCMTFSQFTNSDYLLYSRIVLTLHPGNHHIDTDISIFNISEFRLQPSQVANTTISCERQASFIVDSVTSVSIRDLTFVGCGGNVISAVDEIFIENSIFYGLEETRSALILNGTTLANINGTVFMSNKRGSYLDEEFTSRVGGAIIVNIGSKVSLSNTMFINNSADLGGAIYAQAGSSIMVNECTFIENNAVVYGSVIYAYESNIFITTSQFSSNRGPARSRSLFFVDSEATISWTNFTQNTEVIFVVFTTLTLTECNFNNNNVTGSNGATGFISLDYGAVVLADVSDVMMNRCQFHANEAINIGGIIVLTSSTLIFNVTLLSDNKAFDGTVFMIESDVSFTERTEFKNNIGALVGVNSRVIFSGLTSFLNNTSSTREIDNLRGGAITFYLGELYFTEPSSSVVFLNNLAESGGAFYTVETVVYIFSNIVINSNVARYVGGGIFAYQTPFFVYSNVSISNNTAVFGGGIYATSASITTSSSTESASHSLTIVNNTAIYGGGIFLSSYSRLYLFEFSPRSHNITVRLAFNSAHYGGAVYVTDDKNVEMCAGEMTVDALCSFQVLDIYEGYGTQQLNFESNTASVSGPLMFGGLLDRCTLTTVSYSLFFSTNLDQSSTPLNGSTSLYQISNIENLDSLTSLPVTVCFCVDNQPDCSLNLLNTQMQKGRNFSTSVTALDHVDHSLNATILVELPSTTGGLGDGQHSQIIAKLCTNLTLSVTSTASSETIVIYPEGPCGNARPSIKKINVTFSDCDCPIGFDVNLQKQSTCECQCSEAINYLIHNCIFENSSFQKIGNSWIDYDNESGIMFSRICPYDYCLPYDSVDINLNIPNGANVQCANNRAGILCGSCQPQFSLSIGQSGCVKCGHLWPLNTTLIVLSTLITGILVVIAILFLNLTVTAGTINGFIFSANILKAVFPFPTKEHGTHFISFLNLDFTLDVCYYDGYDAYTKAWLEIAFPVYLFTIVFVVIILTHLSTRFAKLIGKRNPVETLATLIFLSYAKLLQFTIKALSFGKVEYLNGGYDIVWLPDAHIGYLKGKHIPMFIAAVIVLFAVLLYTIVLLLWQWLLKCPISVIRNTKLQSFIDMYHVPNNNRHRYWTGLLLLIRLMIYVITVSTTSSDTSGAHLAIISFLSTIFIFKSFSVRVYKKWTVDVLESVLIVNTIILTAVSLNAANSSKLMMAAVYIHTVVIGTLFIAVILYHVNHYILHIEILKQLKNIQSKFHKRSQSQTETDTSPPVLDMQNAPKYINAERHASIFDILGPPTDSDYQRMKSVRISREKPTSTVVEEFV